MTVLEKYEKEQEALQAKKVEVLNELNEKQNELKQLENEKKQFQIDHWQLRHDSPDVRQFDKQIEQAQKDMEGLRESLDIVQININQLKQTNLKELRDERQELLTKHNAELEKLKLEIFEEKLKFLKKLDDVYTKKNELQGEIENYNDVIGDKTGLTSFVIYAPDYLVQGIYREDPIAPQKCEIDYISGGVISGRLSPSYKLYKLTGEIEINLEKAQLKLNEALSKGGK